MSEIQHIGDKEYIEYRGTQMRILHLSNYLQIQKPTNDFEFANIIIPKETHIPVGILIQKVIDTRTLFIDISEGSFHGDGVLGSTLIDKKITLLLDLYAILEMGEPDSLHRVSFEQKTIASSKILLVEDTPLFLTIVKEYLSSVGFNVTTAINGVIALDIMNKESFDLILSDIEMPEMDGWGLIKEIRSNPKWNDLPVIALTSLNDESDIKQGLRAGFNEWMIKLDKEKILDCMDRYLG